ncbi:MAG: Uma2 family endonuclease [Gemmataceae bacterium]|nr:Uma2 family endonuclease [Gemmataceae bacterium]
MIANLIEPRRRLWSRDEFDQLSELGFFDGQTVDLRDGEIRIRSSNADDDGLQYSSDGPHARLWTKAEYYRLGELGFFDGQKVELWEGEIVVSSPRKWLHASTVDRVAEVLRNHFGNGYWVRTQLPVDLGQVREPEPDVSVVPGGREDYTAHPTAAELIVEVSDTTLAAGRGPKGSLYARGGVSDYWIINLVDQRLEVYRNPQSDPAQRYGYGYANATTLQATDVIVPLALPLLRIPVTELLG